MYNNRREHTEYVVKSEAQINTLEFDLSKSIENSEIMWDRYNEELLKMQNHAADLSG